MGMLCAPLDTGWRTVHSTLCCLSHWSLSFLARNTRLSPQIFTSCLQCSMTALTEGIEDFLVFGLISMYQLVDTITHEIGEGIGIVVKLIGQPSQQILYAIAFGFLDALGPCLIEEA